MRSGPLRYILFNKPFGVVSQFTGLPGARTLADFGPFPGNVYPAGRLDADSEGLLLLTNDNLLKRRLLEPRFGHLRTYLVQVERVPSEETLQRLREGVPIGDRLTKPAQVTLLDGEPSLPPRPVPVRFRKNVPTAWLQITLREGRNRQIRRMTASVAHPTLRLVRTAIGPLTIQGIRTGEFRELSPEEVRDLTLFLGGSRPGPSNAPQPGPTHRAERAVPSLGTHARDHRHEKRKTKNKKPRRAP